jgi:hypothetical protein
MNKASIGKVQQARSTVASKQGSDLVIKISLLNIIVQTSMLYRIDHEKTSDRQKVISIELE